jgi:predicted nucleotidyltransferase
MATVGSLPESLALQETDREQIAEALATLREVLGDELIGAYLHGSAILGGLRAQSDIDLVAVSARRMSPYEKAVIVARLLAVSGPDPAAAPPRPLELTSVVWSEVRPWVYPARMDFQYGEWWREEFERGKLEPWPSGANPDLATIVTMVLLGEATLAGPPPSEVFDPVPSADLTDALVAGVGALLDDIDWDTRNVVLTLARIWSGVATSAIQSKDVAAEWALPRLASEHREVLVRARDIYLGNEEEHWEDLQGRIRPFADAIIAEIMMARSTLPDRTL